MKNDKFDTFLFLLSTAFTNMSEGANQQHVTIVSEHGYNLTMNFVLHSEYPEIVVNAPKMEFSEVNFLPHLPREFGVDLTTDQLAKLFEFLKLTHKVTSMAVMSHTDALFLFTDKEIILMMREPYDKSGIN